MPSLQTIIASRDAQSTKYVPSSHPVTCVETRDAPHNPWQDTHRTLSRARAPHTIPLGCLASQSAVAAVGP